MKIINLKVNKGVTDSHYSFYKTVFNFILINNSSKKMILWAR